MLNQGDIAMESNQSQATVSDATRVAETSPAEVSKTKPRQGKAPRGGLIVLGATALVVATVVVLWHPFSGRS
jgi:hypothetical protein